MIRLPVSNSSASPYFMTSSNIYDPFLLQWKSDSICSTESDPECYIFTPENEPPQPFKVFKKFITERKLEQLPKWAESMTQPQPDEKSTKTPHFALFTEENLSRLNKQNSMAVEKRLMGVVFKISMSAFRENEGEGPVFPSGTTAHMLMPFQDPNLLSKQQKEYSYMDTMSSN